MARPSKLNEELIQNIANEIAEGTPIGYACDLFMITDQTYRNWMQRGEEDFNNEQETLYAEFFGTIKKSYALFVKEARKKIRKGEPGWQGTAWWLERTNPKFMPKQQIQADDDGKVTVVIGGKQKNVSSNLKNDLKNDLNNDNTK